MAALTPPEVHRHIVFCPVLQAGLWLFSTHGSNLSDAKGKGLQF